VAILSISDAQAHGWGRHHHHHQHRHHHSRAALLDQQPEAEPASVDSEGGRALQSGLASWYGPGFHGRRTASGERFNANDLTAAHPSLPFGTRIRVVNQSNGASVVVRINDRGPHCRGRIIDLSRASAHAIGISGAARVRLVSLG
jgi:rare lipoprotein A